MLLVGLWLLRETNKIQLICFIIDDIHAQSEYTYELFSFVRMRAATAATILFLLLFPIFVFFFVLVFLFSLSLFLSSLNVVKCVKQVKESHRHRIY